jgi:hypothetical protein
VSTTLDALAAFGDEIPPPGPGRWVEDLAPPGFEIFAGMPQSHAAAMSADEPTPEPAEPQPVIELTRPVNDVRAMRHRLALQTLAEAEQDVLEAARAVDNAERAADDAAAAADAAEQAYRRARAEAEAAARRAEHAVASWKRDAKQAEALAEAAQTARARQREAEEERRARADEVAALEAAMKSS